MQNQIRIRNWHSGVFGAKASELLMCSLLFLTQPASAESAYQQQAPGEMVPIGTHYLHLYCKGNTAPTILIDSGMGNLALEWKNLQQQLSERNRVCLYDRAGYGWSDPGPVPRTSQQIANELYYLIQASNLAGPFVLVGHSFGGYNMRLFASQHPELTAGLVLVDSSHPDQFSRMQLDPRAEIARLMNQSGAHRNVVSRPVIPENYPEEIKYLAYQLLSSRKSLMTRLNEQYHFEQSAEQVQQAGSLPNVPLVVLTHGKKIWPNNPEGDRMENIWSEMQQELSYLTTVSLQIIAKSSGHAIHLDQPDLVASAILNIVAVSEYAVSANSPSMIPTAQYETASIFNFSMTDYHLDAIPAIYHNDSRYALRIH